MYYAINLELIQNYVSNKMSFAYLVKTVTQTHTLSTLDNVM